MTRKMRSLLLGSVLLVLQCPSPSLAKSWSLALNVRVAPGARDCFFIAKVGVEHELEVDFEVMEHLYSLC